MRLREVTPGHAILRDVDTRDEWPAARLPTLALEQRHAAFPELVVALRLTEEVARGSDDLLCGQRVVATGVCVECALDSGDEIDEVTFVNDETSDINGRPSQPYDFHTQNVHRCLV